MTFVESARRYLVDEGEERNSLAAGTPPTKTRGVRRPQKSVLKAVGAFRWHLRRWAGRPSWAYASVIMKC